ncbi:MAG: hypothetical protein KA419_19910 [Acidobacteria bacterium]|nr:hypothetical protein [Acidobacteriota bacterium]
MAVSYGDQFIPHEMKTDHLGHFRLVEVTVNSVPHLPVKVRDGFGLREDRHPQGAGGKASLRFLVYDKDNFHHDDPFSPLSCLRSTLWKSPGEFKGYS